MRGISTSTAAALADAPALATKAASSSGGLASMLGFGSTRIDTPLSVSTGKSAASDAGGLRSLAVRC